MQVLCHCLDPTGFNKNTPPLHAPSSHAQLHRFVCLQLFTKYSSHCNTTAAQLQTVFFSSVSLVLFLSFHPFLFCGFRVYSDHLKWFHLCFGKRPWKSVNRMTKKKKVYLGYWLFFQTAGNPEAFSAPYRKSCFQFVRFKNVFKVLQVWGLHESIKSEAHTFVLLPRFRLTDTSSTEEE